MGHSIHFHQTKTRRLTTLARNPLAVAYAIALHKVVPNKPLNLKAMKSILVFLLMSSTAQPPSNGHPEKLTDASFDAFIELFHAALATGDPDIYTAFFADSVNIVLPGEQRLVLTPEACVAELTEFGRPDELLTHLAHGFAKLERSDGPSFATVHNQPPQHQFVRVHARNLRFRRLPGSNAGVIAQLHQGIYSGTTDPNVPLLCERSTGIEWMQLELLLPTLGRVKGYAAADYIELIPRNAPRAMRVDAVNGKWLITELSAL